MTNFGPKPWVNLFEKMSIFRLSQTFYFYSIESRCFVVKYHKRHFSILYCLKNKDGKMAILGPKPWVTPLENCHFFDFLNFLFLQLRKAFFRCRIPQKTFSWPILPKKKKLEKWKFLNQNHGLTPLAKCHFFDFLNFLFLQPRKAFFRCRIS